MPAALNRRPQGQTKIVTLIEVTRSSTFRARRGRFAIDRQL
jgi:hypothetical protein